MRDRYSRDEVERLFEHAYTAEEVRAAGEAAGFSREELETSARRLDDDRKKRRHLELGAGLLIVVLATIIFGPSLAGEKANVLPIHNEHRGIGFDVEILVPIAAARDCTRTPDTRHDANAYCLLRRQNVRPKDRTRIGLPNTHDACPQVWVRTFSNGEQWHSNVFELPASVEIERDGALDQKGLGAPNRYSAPAGELADVIPSCGGTT